MKLLSEKDMYGYEIAEELKKYSESSFKMKAGELYPLLHSLEQKGYLHSYNIDIDEKIRKYYSITNSGKKALTQKTECRKKYTKTVNAVMRGEL